MYATFGTPKIIQIDANAGDLHCYDYKMPQLLIKHSDGATQIKNLASVAAALNCSCEFILKYFL